MPEVDSTPESFDAPQTAPAPAPALPSRLDHYDILGRLGEGGMGEVYLARDQRLGRQVALKMLAGRYTADPNLRERFLSEARAVSALEHPHICRLYDVGEWQTRPYFTMERLRGETLRDRLRQGPLPASEIRRIGAEVAEALAVAHERGILHCDIKPSNLFLTTDGGAKVMDFGIARRLQAAVTTAKPASDESTISGELHRGESPVGTPFYMSPEQVRGDELDPRADQFSLGSVLYEMASGRLPFRAPSVVETYAAILREKPTPLTVADAALAATIERMLEKDRGNRFASLEELAKTLRSGIRPASSAGSSPAGRSWILFAAAGVVAMLGLVAAFRPIGKSTPPTLSPLVSNAGDKDAPSLSPTGDRVVFAWTNEQGNNVDVYVKMASGGPPLRITAGTLTETNPAWSPDGQRIAFLRTGLAGVNGENGYYVVPALGGEERKIAPSYRVPNMNGGTNLAWSRDGKSLTICDRLTPDGPAAMFTADVETHAVKTLIEGKGYVSNPIYSPDGTKLAYTRGPGFISHDLFVMDLKTGSSRQLTKELRSIAGVAWTPDSRSLVFSSNRHGLFSLWRIDAAGGEPQPLTVGGSDAVSPSISLAGGRLSYLSRRVNINLWRYPLEGGGQPERLISSTRISTEPDYSPDGSHIVFASERSGSWEIWTARADGSQPLQLTNMPGQQSASPRWSPDSKSIVFDSRFAGHADLVTIGAQGEGLRRLTTDASDEFLPRFSRDGKWIYFLSNRGGGPTQLWRMPAPSEPAAPPVQITVKGLTDAVESEDRKFLYISRGNKLWRMPVDAHDEQGITEVLPRSFWRDFSLVPGGVIYATGWVNLVQTVERMDWATGQKKKLMEIGPRPNLYGPFVVSPDRKWLLTDRVDQQNVEIMLVDNFR